MEDWISLRLCLCLSHTHVWSGLLCRNYLDNLFSYTPSLSAWPQW